MDFNPSDLQSSGLQTLNAPSVASIDQKAASVAPSFQPSPVAQPSFSPVQAQPAPRTFDSIIHTAPPSNANTATDLSSLNPLSVPQAQAQSPKYMTAEEYNQKVQEGVSAGLPKDQVDQMILGAGYVVGGIKSFTPQQYAQKVQEGVSAGYSEDQSRQMMKEAGYTLPAPLPPPPPTFEQGHPVIAGLTKGLMEMMNAPGDLASGVAQKLASYLPGMEKFGQSPDAQNIGKNLGNTAKDAWMAGTAALSGGMSLLPEMGMGALGMGGGELLNQNIQNAGGFNPQTSMNALGSTAVNAAMGAATPLLGPASDALSPLTKPITDALGEGVGGAIDATGARPLVDTLKEGILPLPAKAVKSASADILSKYNTAVKPSLAGIDTLAKSNANESSVVNGMTSLVKNAEDLGVKTLPKTAVAAQQMNQKMLTAIGQRMENVASLATEKGITVPTDGMVKAYNEFASSKTLSTQLKDWALGEAQHLQELGSLTPVDARQFSSELSTKTRDSAFSSPDELTKTAVWKNVKSVLDDNLNTAIDHGLGQGQSKVGDGMMSQLSKEYADQKVLQEDFAKAANKERLVPEAGKMSKIQAAGSMVKDIATSPLHPLTSAGRIANLAGDAAKNADAQAAMGNMFKAAGKNVDASAEGILSRADQHIASLKSIEKPSAPASSVKEPITSFRVNDPNAGVTPKATVTGKVLDVSEVNTKPLYTEAQIQSRLAKTSITRTPSGEYKVNWTETGKPADVQGKAFKGQFLSAKQAKQAFAEALRKVR